MHNVPGEKNATSEVLKYLSPREFGKRLVSAPDKVEYLNHLEELAASQKKEVKAYQAECEKIEAVTKVLTAKIKKDINDINFLKLHERKWTINHMFEQTESNTKFLQELNAITTSGKPPEQIAKIFDFTTKLRVIADNANNTEKVSEILVSIKADYPESITVPLCNAIKAITTLEQQLDADIKKYNQDAWRFVSEDITGFEAYKILAKTNETGKQMIEEGIGFDGYVKELKQKALSTLVEKQYTSSQAPDKRERYWLEFFVCLITLGFVYPANNFLPNSPRGIQKVSDRLEEEEGFLQQENRESAVYSTNLRSSTIKSPKSTPSKKSETTSPKNSLTK